MAGLDFISSMTADREAKERAKRQRDAYATNIPGATGEMTDVPDTLRMKLSGALGEGLKSLGMSGRGAYDLGSRTTNVAELSPLGFATAGSDLANARTMPEAQMAIMGLIPGMRGEAKVAEGLADTLARSVRPAVSKLTGGRIAGPRPGEVLPGAPGHIQGPVPHVVAAAEDYANRAGIDLSRQSHYGTASPRRGGYIANAYERMPHAPEDPAVNAAYEAMARETMGQWEALQRAGTKIDFIKPGSPDPYPGGPTEAIADLRNNNHLWVFPTEGGFGPQGSVLDVSSSPLLKETGINVGGHNMLVNDAFRAVHDYFGHGMEGANFGARGEENAWRAHSRLYSPEALPAVTSETRGQNSWVNYGPYGAANRANQRDTVFAEQKTGVMPPWTQREGGMPMSYRAKQAGGLAALTAISALAGSSREREKR